MTRVKYVGPYDGVDLVGVGTVKRNGVVDVPAAVAKSLDEQADWQLVKTPPKRRKTTTKPSGKPAAEKNEE